MKKFLIKKNKAFTLVETLVALSIFTVSLLALMSILASGIANTNYAKQKVAATYLAQEGIEYIRNARDTSVLYDPGGPQDGWDTFKSTFSSTYLSPDPYFIRTVSMTLTGSLDEVIISSMVSWTQGSGNYSVTFSEHLFNWVE